MGADLFAAGVVAFLLTYLIHSTLLLSGAWLLTNALPARSVRLSERVWRVAFLGGFVTAGLQLGLGLKTPVAQWALHSETLAEAPAEAPAEVPADVVVAEATEPPTERAAPAATEPAAPSSAAPLHFHTPEYGAVPQRELPQVPWSAAPAEEPVVLAVWQEPAGAAPRAPLSPAALEPIGTLPDEPTAWTTWIALGFGAAALVVFGFLSVLVVRLRNSLSGRRELDSGPLPVQLEQLQSDAGVRRRVRLYVAPCLTAPISVGWLRPAICVPPRALTDLAPEEQEAMLAHELAHLARRDPMWFFTCWLIESLFFFQPLNRLARRRLQDAAEILCDDWAVRHTGRDLSLASCLARIAEWIVKRPRPLLAAHMTNGVPATANHARSRLGRRIERLLDDHKVQEPPRRWIAPVATALLASLTLVGPGVAAVGADDPEPEPAPEPTNEPTNEPWPEPTPSPEPTPTPSPEPRPEPRPEPIVLPIQPGELSGATGPAPAPDASALEGDLTSLDEEVELLEIELRELRADLERLDLDPRFDEALCELESATRDLGERRGRLESLVQRAQARGLRP
jgi:beta-lactamase regulating signal transducer with metallopeptidase domain